MIPDTPQTGWKHYTGKELGARFDLSHQELAECAAEGLILPPAPRSKGRPYSQMDYLRLRVYKRCLQAGYGLTEVLDLIGRIHRRTAPIKTVILAKAFAGDKLSELEARMAGGDALEQVNLRCDADILRSYIEDLTRLQKDMGSAAVDDTASLKDVPVRKSPRSDEKDTAAQRVTPPAQTKRRPKAKRSYPRPHGSLAEDSRQLWRGATPGGRMGWAVVLLALIVIVGGYLYLRQPELLWQHFSPQPPAPAPQMEPADLQPASTESAAKGPSERDAPKSPQPPAPTTVPSKKETPRAKAKGSLTETAASDLEKIMAASGETAAASDRAEADTAAPRVIRINELFVFYDPQTRILRAKVELLKNLVAQAPAVIGGHIIIVLKPVGDKHKVTTLPRIPFATDKWSDFAQHGAPFSLEDQKTLYIKTQLSKQPPRQQQLTIYVFDKKQNLLLRETHITKIKLS